MSNIGIVGSRKRDSIKELYILQDTVEKLFIEGDVIISGGCNIGADHYAETIARDLGCTIIIHHANWKKYGNKAGHIRNQKIANDSDVLIALPSLSRDGGTESTIQKYIKTGKKMLVIL